MFQHGASAPWSGGAVHDTVAAIVRDHAYARSLGQSLVQRALAWLFRMVRDVADLFRGSASGRTLTLVLLGILVLLIIARFAMLARANRESREPSYGTRRRDRARDAWATAERLAAAGRHTEAAHALFEALVAACAARGELRVHPSKTAGDYARELSLRAWPAAVPFRLFRARYDAVIYGAGACDRNEYAELLQHARPLLERVGAT